MYFRKSRLQKTWLDKCLKRRVSEDSETKNMPNGSKCFCNLNASTLTIVINHCEGSCIGKKSLLVTQKFLRVFLKALPADE